MSYTLSFTVTADERSCQQWQAKLGEFLAASGIQVPPGAQVGIAPSGGAGGGAPPRGGPPALAYAAAPPPAAAYPTATYAAAPPPLFQPPATPAPKPAAGAAPPAAVSKLLEQVRKAIRQHGAVGIAGIGRKFRICDDNDSKSIDREEFVKCMHELGFKYTDAEVNLLYGFFDQDGSGTINYDEFLESVRPPMPLRRKRLVQKVFEMLDSDKSGVLTADDLKSRFNPQGDPRVQGRKLNASQVAAEFLSTFDVFDQDGNVGPDEFLKYYQGVSASIDEDDYFELMIRNAWHMSGGVGWCANTTCLRVLVCHTDGTQTVEEVKNDLGIDKNNRADVIKRLKNQGITDIQDIKLTA